MPSHLTSWFTHSLSRLRRKALKSPKARWDLESQPRETVLKHCKATSAVSHQAFRRFSRHLNQRGHTFRRLLREPRRSLYTRRSSLSKQTARSPREDSVSHACSSAGRHTRLGTSLSEREGATQPREGHGREPLEAKVVESLLCVGNDRQNVSDSHASPKGTWRLKWSAVKREKRVRHKV